MALLLATNALAQMPDGANPSATATRVPPLPLRVGGFVPFTTTDYPDALAAVVFCQGCPWQCAYCHNPHLQPPRGEASTTSRGSSTGLPIARGLLDAVVFSGGEPTAQAALGQAIDDVRAQGFDVGLHTGGAYPRRLAKALAHASWVGIDVKAPGDVYASVTGVDGSDRAAYASLDLVRNAGDCTRGAHDGPSGGHAARRPRAAGARTRRTRRDPLGPAAVSSNRLRQSGAGRGGPGRDVLDAALLARLSDHVPIIEVRG